VPKIEISIPDQTLTLRSDQGRSLKRYLVSTSRNGAGESRGVSAPRGRAHRARENRLNVTPSTQCLSDVARQGRSGRPELTERFPGRDWILTRILWLSGCEPGKNRLREVDTMRRYIYIHGSPDSVALGKPGSIGCIRMRNQDIVGAFRACPAGHPSQHRRVAHLMGNFDC